MNLISLLATMDDQGHWRFGIGDPTLIGWLTVAAYASATLGCLAVWRADRKASREGRLASPKFWMILTLLLLFLGINKQLDLQTLLNDFGRRTAKAQGWYAQRRIYQVIFIAAVTIAGAIAIGVFSWMGRRQWRRNLLTLIGIVFLYVFVLIRASSIHHVDVMLQWTWMGWKWNWILELGGIAVVALGALLALSRRSAITKNHKQRSTDRPDDAMGPRRYTYGK